LLALLGGATIVVVSRLRVNAHRKTILPLVLYGYEIWSLTLREEQSLWEFQTRVLWKIFGPKQQNVTQEWRKLHNEDLHDLYSSPNILWVIKSKRMRWAVNVASMGRREIHTEYW
jgi:hypothetical protein